MPPTNCLPPPPTCNLCALTYTPTGLPRWRRFVKTLPWPVEFLHKDELAEQYGQTDADLPAVFLWDGRKVHPWLSAAEMDGFQSLDELITAVASRSKEATIVNR